MDVRYQSNGNRVTLTTAKSRGVYAVSESSISERDFFMKTKRSYLEEMISLAYGIGLPGTPTQRLLPNEAIGPGSRWQHVITHEFGGMITVFHLESIDGLGQATIEFERFVCLRNVPHASPDGELEPACRNDTEEIRVEQGKLLLRQGLPLPNVTASMLKRVVVGPVGQECGEPVVSDMRGEIELVWVAEQSAE